MSDHPLDRPVWNALTGVQHGCAVGALPALRFAPDLGLFAAAADRSDASLEALAALCPAGGAIGLVEPEDWPTPRGLMVRRAAACDQMIAEYPTAPEVSPFDIVDLGDDDAPEMLALATLTQPGPFFSRTHRLGNFIGVRIDGRLAAMAGERLHVGHFREVSGVCTHPDFRGRGLAGALMPVVAGRMIARGETPFLHTYSDNHGAIALYERLGFRRRRRVIFAVLERLA
jgi:predicted GNAT family acetyltransferase